MISRNALQCTTCGKPTTTRTAIGHEDYQEFAFPCHGCGVEIRFGMTLDQTNAGIEYSKIVNAVWSNAVTHAPILTFDGENLNPLKDGHFSPFLATFGLAKDFDTFREHQSTRMYFVHAIWPKLERAIVHLERKQFSFLAEELRDLEYDGPITNEKEGAVALTWATQHYGSVFGSPDPAPRSHIASRISLVEKSTPAAVDEMVAHFLTRGRQVSIANELHRIRRQWAKLHGFLFPIYTSFYWDDAKHSLDEYTIGQKRFDELKPFYVDCFETLCRVSCIAAAIEGVIERSAAIVPSKKGMAIGDFELMANGSKPDILNKLCIADLFVPFIDSHLRNGMGHNAARYDVSKDTVIYVNENDKGKVEHTISYVRFCEKVVLAYAQLELVSKYANWLFVRCS